MVSQEEMREVSDRALFDETADTDGKIMKLDFLHHKSWIEISREERLYCAELYFTLKQNPQPFFDLLKIPNYQDYEVGYEVCFYRDILKEHEESAREKKYPPKRTFDLALMSDKEIIIIEAKAQQGFDSEQLKDIENDKILIPKLFHMLGLQNITVSVCAVCSDKYKPEKETKKYFEHCMRWSKIAAIYPNSKDIFTRANDIYGD